MWLRRIHFHVYSAYANEKLASKNFLENLHNSRIDSMYSETISALTQSTMKSLSALIQSREKLISSLEKQFSNVDRLEPCQKPVKRHTLKNQRRTDLNRAKMDPSNPKKYFCLPSIKKTRNVKNWGRF
jgi:hypothetical protein